MSEQANRSQKTSKVLKEAKPAILPSLLMCDFSNLEREVRRLEEAGVEVLHLDVMDGHFVPNLTYGMPIVSALRKVTDSVLDVHLMISEPERYAQQFIEAGADVITYHIETLPSPADLLQKTRDQGVLSGLAINPQTDLDLLLPHLSECDLVLIMSVQAGFGGQTLNPVALERLAQLRAELGPGVLLEVDGGVNEKTIGPCVAAGADLLVVGSALFGHPDYCLAISRLQAAMKS
jgi:ribulose-phosphate 3-epimerase